MVPLALGGVRVGLHAEARFVRQLDRLEMGLQAALQEAEGFQGMAEFYDSARKPSWSRGSAASSRRRLRRFEIMANRFVRRIRSGDIGPIEELKSEFRELAKLTHPDVRDDASGEFAAVRSEFKRPCAISRGTATARKAPVTFRSPITHGPASRSF